MTQDITIEEIIRLDNARSRGNWIKSETATNPRKGIFTSYPTVYSAIKEDGSEIADICRMTYDTATADATFIAAAPRIAAKCLELYTHCKTQDKIINDLANDSNRWALRWSKENLMAKELVVALKLIRQGFIVPDTATAPFHLNQEDMKHIATEALTKAEAL